jgi:hypothetical protein
MGSGPVHDRLARTLTRALPGDEQPTGCVERGWISFDMLIRILTGQFREQLPRGWKIRSIGRSDGLSLNVPGSGSEEDYRIDMGWIVASDRSVRERLLEVTRATLANLQAAVADATSTSWPAKARGVSLPDPHAEIAGDTVNPRLRLWYGPSEALLNSIVQD